MDKSKNRDTLESQTCKSNFGFTYFKWYDDRMQEFSSEQATEEN